MTDFNGNLLTFFGRKWVVVFSHPKCWDFIVEHGKTMGIFTKNTTIPEIFGEVYTK
jgi:hypothetical protein